MKDNKDEFFNHSEIVFNFFNKKLSYLSIATNGRKFLIAQLPFIVSFMLYVVIIIYIQRSFVVSLGSFTKIFIMLLLSFLPILIARAAHQTILKKRFPDIFDKKNRVDHGKLERKME